MLLTANSRLTVSPLSQLTVKYQHWTVQLKCHLNMVHTLPMARIWRTMTLHDGPDSRVQHRGWRQKDVSLLATRRRSCRAPAAPPLTLKRTFCRQRFSSTEIKKLTVFVKDLRRYTLTLTTSHVDIYINLTEVLENLPI